MSNHTAPGDGLPNGHDNSDEETHQLFIRAVLMLTLIAVAMNLNAFLHRKHFHYLGESALYILLGLLVAMGWTAISYDEQNKAIQLSSKFFYMVLLPPIIFEGGFALQRVSFFQNVLTIVSLAFIGALYSTFVTSILMYFFSKLITPWSFVESLVFGSLISSTDPVTVLSLLPANVDKRLYMLIFGESALNDAVSIILYRFFTEIADPKMRLSAGTFIVSVLASAGVFLGSLVIGVLFGLALAKITKHVKVDEKEEATYEMAMILICAYTSYLVADLLSLTGIISIFFTGITVAHYVLNNLGESTRANFKSTLRMIAFMCECFIFLYLGLGLLSFGNQTVYQPMLVFFACVSILISRTHVFIILGFSNFARTAEDIVPFKHQLLMWFSGLRGAVAFALGVTFLEHPIFDATIKGQIFGTTVMVVVLTVLVLGGFTPYMLKWLGLATGEEEKAGHPTVAPPTTNTGENAIVPGQQQQPGGYETIEELPELDEEAQILHSNKSPFFAWLYQFDAKYIRPHFTTLTEANKQTLNQIQTARQIRAASRQESMLSMRGRAKSNENVEGDKMELLKTNRNDDAVLHAVDLDDENEMQEVKGDAM